MPVVAYLTGPLRALAQAAKAAGAPMQFREPSMWDGTIVPGHDCYAPAHPRIREAYANAGASVLETLPMIAIAQEITGPLPTPARVLIACPGPHLLESLQAHPEASAADLVIVVNQAAAFVAGDWWIALDGHTTRGAGDVMGEPTAIVADDARQPPSMGTYRRLSALGKVSQHGLSLIAAITAAAALRPSEIILAGVDWVPGAGIDGGTTNRGADRWAQESQQAEAILHQLAQDGIPSYRLHPDGNVTPYADAPAATLTPLTSLSGLGDRLADTLHAAHGIDSVEALREAAATLQGRRELAKLRGITTDLLVDWLGPLDSEQPDSQPAPSTEAEPAD